jgi:hypothetical protein
MAVGLVAQLLVALGVLAVAVAMAVLVAQVLLDKEMLVVVLRVAHQLVLAVAVALGR